MAIVLIGTTATVLIGATAIVLIGTTAILAWYLIEHVVPHLADLDS